MGELDEATSERTSSQARAEKLEVALEARGGNVASALARGAGAESDNSGDVEEQRTLQRAMELRKELQTLEEQSVSLRTSLQRAEDSNASSVARLQSKLEAAREELQTSMKEASAAHEVEVAKLEDAVRFQRQQVEVSNVSRRNSELQIEQLEAARSAASDQHRVASASMTSDATACTGELDTELRRVRAAQAASVERAAAMKARIAETKRKQLVAEEEGAKRVAKLRTMIEQLWEALRVQARSRDLR